MIVVPSEICTQYAVILFVSMAHDIVDDFDINLVIPRW